MPLVGVAASEGEAEDPVAGAVEVEPSDGDGIAVWSAEVGAGVALDSGRVDVVGDPQATATSATERRQIAQFDFARFMARSIAGRGSHARSGRRSSAPGDRETGRPGDAGVLSGVVTWVQTAPSMARTVPQTGVPR